MRRTTIALIAFGVVAGAPVAPAALPAAARAAPTPCQVTYTNTVEAPINAGVADDSTAIDVPEAGTVVDVDVQVDVTHPAVGDVALTLLRGGHAITLTDGVGGSGDDFDNTIFDDSATLSISQGIAPFPGRYRPLAPLTVVNGVPAQGQWRFLAKHSTPVAATLHYWRIVLTLESCDLDADGVEDHADRCLDLAGATASGCPVKARSITLKYGAGRFYGRISSTVRGCIASRPLTVWKVVAGPDRKLGATKSRSNGEFALRTRRKQGTYYAVTPRVVVTGKGECAKTTSSRLTLR